MFFLFLFSALATAIGFTLLKKEPSTNMSHKGFCDPSSISCGHHDMLLSLDHRRFVEALTLSMLSCSLDTLLNGVIPISCLGQTWSSSGIFTPCISSRGKITKYQVHKINTFIISNNNNAYYLPTIVSFAIIKHSHLH